uniref:Variant surface glycoprotein 634 n=1 Tax=Trypanosoma brucei TaxID=5691 RepID=M4TDP5_9TRYP|nr:variant surface glycoprotein 634 [Trypanosoma brucei]
MALITLLSIVAALADANEPSGDQEHNKVTTSCQESAFSRDAADKYLFLASTTADVSSDLHRQAAVWSLAAAEETDADKSALLTGLAAHATELAFAAHTKLKAKNSALTKAALLLSRRSGFLSGILAGAAVKYGAQSNPFKGSGNAVTLRLGDPTNGSSSCDENAQKSGANKIQTTAVGNPAWKAVKYTAAADLAKHRPKITIALTTGGSCTDTGGGGATYTNQVSSCTTPLGGGTTAAEEAQTAPTLSEEQLFADSTGKRQCKEKLAGPGDAKDEKKVLLNAICEAQLAAAIQVTTLADLKPTDLAASTAILTAVRNGNGRYGKVINTEDEMHTASLKKYIITTLGETPEKFTELFIDKLKNEDVSYRGHKETTKVKRQALAEQQEAGAAIAYFQDKKAVKPQAEKAKESSTAKKCKADTDENKCTEDKDCEYEDGKCKLKEGVKAEGNDAKTTNTTGSNSVFINKAHLSLKFYI